MNRIKLNSKWGIIKEYYGSEKININNMYDTKLEADQSIKEKYWLGKPGEVLVIDGDYTPGECKAYPIAVTVIKYKDFNGNLWETAKDCEMSNACHILNTLIGSNVFKYKINWHGSYEFKIEFGTYKFTIKEQSQIDALWTVFKSEYETRLKSKVLLKDVREPDDVWYQDVEEQRKTISWLIKLNNIQKMFDAYGSVNCKMIHIIETDYCRGEDYVYEKTQLLVKLNKTGVEFIAKNPDDETCNTCKYRETDCGYSCKDSNPRCYVEATNKDISARPEVYEDSFDKQDVYDWNELFEYDFDVSKTKISV